MDRKETIKETRRRDVCAQKKRERERGIKGAETERGGTPAEVRWKQ